MRRALFPIFIVFSLQLVFAGISLAEEKQELQLSLEGVSELALKNNLDIQIAKFDAYIKRNDIYDAISVFDAILSGEVAYTDDQRKSTSSLGASVSKTNDYSLELEKKLPTGTTLGLGFDHTRNWSNSAYATSNPAHDSQASLSITQEIGKNFFGLIDRNDVKITKLDIENSDYSSIDKIEDYLAEVQKAYWKVVLNREKVKIREEMLDRAESLFKIYTNKTKMGLAENPDLYAAEANMNIRENELLSAQNDLRMAENNLLLKLNMNDRDKINIVIEEMLNTEGVQEQDFIESLRMAISNRRDYKSAFNEIKSKNLKVAMKKNNMWPEIDLEASIARNGVAKYYKDAMDDIVGQDNPKYYYGIKFKYPLENSQAKGQYETAKLEKAKSLVLLKKKEREIVVEINDSVGTVNTSLETVKNSYAVVDLQQKKLDEQEKRFKLGRSDSDTLIRYQNDLLTAKISLADTLYTYYSDFIDLRVKENSLLDSYWKEDL